MHKAALIRETLHLTGDALVQEAQKALQADALSQREMGTHLVQEVSQRHAVEGAKKETHPDTFQLLATLKEESQENLSHHNPAQVKHTLESRTALLGAICEKVAATRTPKTSLQEIPASIIEQIAALDSKEKKEEKTQHHVRVQKVAILHHKRSAEREERTEYYAEEEWNRSETSRRYNAGRRPVLKREGIGEKAHRSVRAFQNKRLEQGRKQQQRKESLLQEYVGFEQLLDTPSSEEKPQPNIHHAHAVSRRPRGREMEGGP